ncbi:hypothetical protein C8R44DRAFT_122175 [Mycena epipterygia]|nr:hypothetical protein C8R44DRAFT_122175 [Mycena epipterygia]
MKSTMLFSLLYLVSFSRGGTAIRNETIDDTDPSVKYETYKPGDTPIRCSSNACSDASTPDSNNYSEMMAGTMTSVAGTITIPFTGRSVSVFFATMHKISCAFHIDGDNAGSFQHNSTQPARGNILGYSNTSLPNGAHELVIISEQGSVMDFDGLVLMKHPHPRLKQTIPKPSHGEMQS